VAVTIKGGGGLQQYSTMLLIQKRKIKVKIFGHMLRKNILAWRRIFLKERCLNPEEKLDPGMHG